MPKSRAVTMNDVARRARVSQATVSYVLNNASKHSISEETRQLVLTAARDLDYRPNLAARDLVTGTSSVVVCVVPPVPLSEPVITFLAELTAAFAEKGAVMAVHFERRGDHSLDVMRKALSPRAVFSLFPRDDAETFQFLDFTTTAFDPGARLQVDHLAQAGHHTLAFAGSAEPELHVQSDARWAAAAARADELGLPAMRMDRVRTDAEGAAAVAAGWHTAGVTAVCANNDEVALAVLRGIREAGLRCPDDLAVIGYDATTVGASSDPTLTSVGWHAAATESITTAVLEGRPLRREELDDPVQVWMVHRHSG